MYLTRAEDNSLKHDDIAINGLMFSWKMMGVSHILKTCHAHQSSSSCKKMEQSEMAKGNMEPSNY
ncbi:hypothetical protein NC651_016120 [Populus alba x Populus x berolinensis]|nr:hypothetical protein NC651_016120 [Populus alba x Populus x berolinensis]